MTNEIIEELEKFPDKLEAAMNEIRHIRTELQILIDKINRELD